MMQIGYYSADSLFNYSLRILNYTLRLNNVSLNFDMFFSRVACAVVAGLRSDFKKDRRAARKPNKRESDERVKLGSAIAIDTASVLKNGISLHIQRFFSVYLPLYLWETPKQKHLQIYF